ncbi:MAG TPA: protoporphyrinogen oxidase [Thermomicrobiales bacterium]|nr:protoporphyrinogen oxidase [Thermomicrobiales bacterium]
MSERRDVIVVGGGMAGLTVAWRLLQYRPDLAVTVLEATERAGGRIRTELLEHEAGRFVIELGPDSILTSKPWARDLCLELGMEDELLPIARAERPTAIWHDGRPVDLPSGLSLLAPQDPGALRQSPLLSEAGRARALAEATIPPRGSDGDESLGSFVRRRFGDEYLEAIGEPLLAGIHNADPDELSLQATFPQFHRMEREHGNVTAGMRRLPPPSGNSLFVAFRNGIQRLPDTLAERLGPIVRYRSRVELLEQVDPGGYRVILTTGQQLTARVVVLATPLWAVRALLPLAAPASRPYLGRFKAAASGAIVLGGRQAQIRRPLPGYGLVVPHREGVPFNAITVMSRKYAGRAPDGWSLMRFFFGGFRSPQTLQLDDTALLEAARAFAATAVGATGAPELVRIARWTQGSPVYQVGHLETVAALEACLPPGLFVTGAPFRGPGIPDVVRSSTELANRIAMSHIPAAV